MRLFGRRAERGRADIALPKPHQVELLAGVLRSRRGTADPEILRRFAAGSAGSQLGRQLEAVLSEEFEDPGFDESGNASPYGSELEDLIDLAVSQSER